MTDDPARVAALAEGLTEAQQSWLCGGEPSNRRGYWPLRHAMRTKGLLDQHLMLTSLGLAVRAHLQQQATR